MSMISLKATLGAVAAAGALLAHNTATAGITLPTQGLKANAVLTFSVAADGSTAAAGLTFAALGTTTQLPDVDKTPPGGRPVFVSSYNLPVTSADVSIGWDLKIKANSGKSSGAALRVTNSFGDVALANFAIDFNKKIVSADFLDIVNQTATKNASLYTFVEKVPQKISFNNLVLNMSVTLSNLVLTPTASTQLGDALNIDPTLRTTLETLDWGEIAILVTSYARKPAVNATPYTLANVPPLAP